MFRSKVSRTGVPVEEGFRSQPQTPAVVDPRCRPALSSATLLPKLPHKHSDSLSIKGQRLESGVAQQESSRRRKALDEDAQDEQTDHHHEGSSDRTARDDEKTMIASRQCTNTRKLGDNTEERSGTMKAGEASRKFWCSNFKAPLTCHGVRS
jgi:hypothetical protein